MILMDACTFLFNFLDLCINAKYHFFLFLLWFGYGLLVAWSSSSLSSTPFSYLLYCVWMLFVGLLVSLNVDYPSLARLIWYEDGLISF